MKYPEISSFIVTIAYAFGIFLHRQENERTPRVKCCVVLLGFRVCLLLFFRLLAAADSTERLLWMRYLANAEIILIIYEMLYTNIIYHCLIFLTLVYDKGMTCI